MQSILKRYRLYGVKSVGNVDEVESMIKEKEKYTAKKKLYADIVIGERTQGTIMLEMRRCGVSTKLAITTDMK